MAPKTRYFLVGSGLVVAVGLCTGLVAFYSGSIPNRSAWRSEMAFVPRTANAVGYADLADIMDSPFLQHIQQLFPTGSDKARFQAETGIDIERDIDSVVVALSGGGAANAAALVVVRGRFDQAKIEQTATANGAATETYRNIRLLIDTPREAGAATSSRPSGLAFLEPGLLAIGTTDAIKQGIDASTSGSSAVQDSELMAAVAGVERSGNAWFVARTAGLTGQPEIPAIVREHMDGVRFFAVGADVDRGIRATVRAETRDLQAAEDLRGVVNGALSAVRLMSGRDARLESALNSIQTSSSGPTVEVQFTVPPELLELAKEGGVWPKGR